MWFNTMAEMKLSKPVKMATYVLLLTMEILVVTAAPTLPPQNAASSTEIETSSDTMAKHSFRSIMKDKYDVDVSEVLRSAIEQIVKEIAYVFSDEKKKALYNQFMLGWREKKPSFNTAICHRFVVGRHPTSLGIVLDGIYFIVNKNSQLTTGLITDPSGHALQSDAYVDVVEEAFGVKVNRLDRQVYAAVQTCIDDLVSLAEKPVHINEEFFGIEQNKELLEHKEFFVQKTEKGICVASTESVIGCVEDDKVYLGDGR